LWDWDNTLVDGWIAIAAALNAVFAARGMPAWTVEETRANVRGSLRDTFPGMFGDGWQAARDLFYATLRTEHLHHLTAMPGAHDALQAGSIWPQAVVSNKNGVFLRAEVAHMGWQPLFQAVVGAGDAIADKPSAAPLLLALEPMGMMAGPSVWYLGDTALDMCAARAAGCTAVLVGDAAHDGGLARAAPDLHFPDGHALAAQLQRFADQGRAAIVSDHFGRATPGED
jgi:phosphoglycolate phosphatase